MTLTRSYESFNARNSSPKEVARTFIANTEYEDLWQKEHTVVLGPRGSGKTTLFKMLTVQALYTWDSKLSRQLRKERPFTAIYVPTDMHWHHQMKHAEERLHTVANFSEVFSKAAVTTAVLTATAQSFHERLECEGPRDSGELERQLCLALAEAWQLAVKFPRLEYVVLALKARVSELRRLVNRVVFEGEESKTGLQIPDCFFLEYFPAMDEACCYFDEIFKLRQSSKWALCLDELELAPAWLQELAFSQQRSTEEKFLIKLSTSPLPSILGRTDARPKHDVRLVCMWNYGTRNDGEFVSRLAQSIIQRRLGGAVSPTELLGTSELMERDRKYVSGSREWQLFKELAVWDRGLRSLLERNGINPDNPIASSRNQGDAIFRKGKNIAIFRDAFLKVDSSGRYSLRSRKVNPVYFGADVVCRVSDGNPRRLIGILDDLCSRVKRDSRGKPVPLERNEQAEVLTRASKHFFGYVHALPGGTVAKDGVSVDLASLLRAVATAFRQSLLAEEFPLDPIGSFFVDSHLDDRLVELLRLGVYHGALVAVDPVPDTIETSLRGKRFRLSFMLSPMNKLPLALHRGLSLTSVLSGSSKRKVKAALSVMSGQQELYPEY